MGMFPPGVLGGCPLCMIWIILGSTLRDSHRVLRSTLLQFNYLFYEVNHVVVVLLCWMDSPTFWLFTLALIELFRVFYNMTRVGMVAVVFLFK
jgi:hypothetical protein